MFNRIFYTIADAASILGNKVEDKDLIHAGSNSEINIYVLTSGKKIIQAVKVFSPNVRFEYEKQVFPGRLLKITSGCLAAFEAGRLQTEVQTEGGFILDPELHTAYGDEIWRNADRFNKEGPLTIEQKLCLIADIDYKVIDKTTGNISLLKDCELVILADDLQRLQQPRQTLTESDRDKLNKQIGVMALLLAEKSSKYKKADKPNALQIAKDIESIIDAFDFPGKKGTGSSEIRASIAAGLKLLQDDD